jgi:hypothetical protein
MSTATPEVDLDQWIEFCANLSAFENFALLGLIIENPTLSLSLLQNRTILTEGNLRAAEKWTLTNLRRALKSYCDNYKKGQVVAGSKFLETLSPFVKTLAPFLMFQLNAPLTAMVAYVIWAIGYGLGKWCGKYSTKEFSGEGEYLGDLTPNKKTAFFRLTYLPPIYEKVEDEKAYPLVVYKAQIMVPAETTGDVRVTSGADLDAITINLRAGNKHMFEFIDAEQKKTISGEAKNVYPKREVGSNVLGLVAEDLTVKPLPA